MSVLTAVATSTTPLFHPASLLSLASTACVSLPSPSLHAQMHLHSKVGDLSVLSGGGNVHIAVSPDAIVALTVKGSSPLQGDAAAGETW